MTTHYSDQDILDALSRAASETGEPLTQAKYENWRDETNATTPGSATITNRIGWSDACDRVGVVSGRYSKELCLDALRTAAGERGWIRRAEYAEWAKEHPSQPSDSTVARAFGGWSAAMAAALNDTPTCPCCGDPALAVISGYEFAVDEHPQYLTVCRTVENGTHIGLHFSDGYQVSGSPHQMTRTDQSPDTTDHSGNLDPDDFQTETHICHECGARSFDRGGSWTRVERGDEEFWRCPDCQPGVE